MARSVLPMFENVCLRVRCWDRSSCIWRDPEDYTRGFLLKTLIVNPFENIHTLASIIQNKTDVQESDFQTHVDILQFRTEEIHIKVAENGTVTVDARHKEKLDEHGFVTRHFIRKVTVPKEYDVNQVYTKLSFDGVLTIMAPKLEKKEDEEKKVDTKPIIRDAHPKGKVEIV